MVVGILSYRGLASLTVIGAAYLLPDPEVITSEFKRDEFHGEWNYRVTPSANGKRG